MSKKEHNNQESGNDLQKLQSILLGAPMAAIEGRLQKLEDHLAHTTEDLLSKIQDLHEDISSRQNIAETGMQNKVDQLESQIFSKIEELKKEISTFSGSERQRLGAYLSEIGKNLMKN